MRTYFASPERKKRNELISEIQMVSEYPLISGMLHSISGIIAVLQENRQIIAVNNEFLKTLEINDFEEVLGLRLGETLQCIYSDTEEGGCGTSKYCSSCGAAIAIVSSLEEGIPVERKCALTVNRGSQKLDIALQVKSNPIRISEKSFLLIFLQDISQQQQWAALERTFFHDINNLLGMLIGAGEILMRKEPSRLSKNVLEASIRLSNEIAIQKHLFQSEVHEYNPVQKTIGTDQILKEVKSTFANHPAAENKIIDITEIRPEIFISIDKTLLLRILSNMVLNALEATRTKGKIKIWLERNEKNLSFCVWNNQKIPDEITNRIFQRNYSTKGQEGRGLGTYSMKLFGEKVLCGKVSFSTSEKEGTVFRYSYPIEN